ncbi:MAG: RNA-binding domain-containing protein [Candidatus Thorarchaeota archaeon]
MPESSGSRDVFVGKVEARAFSRATEIVERVESAVLTIFPNEFLDRVRITRTMAEGHLQVPVVIISATLEGKRRCEPLVTNILSRLSESDKKYLLKSLNRRIDDECIFFLRIDKQAAYLDTIQLAQNTDVISVQIHIRSYPRSTRDEAEDLVANYIKNIGE